MALATTIRMKFEPVWLFYSFSFIHLNFKYFYSRVRNIRRAGNKRSRLENLSKRINIGPGINLGPEKFGNKDKRRALNKLENIHSPRKKNQNLTI